jgi:CheY-like chemotaxis protein
LVVDASQECVDQMVASLRQPGRTVVGTTDPWEAITLVSQVTLDLIILDLDVPGVGGSDICSILRDDPGLQTIPTVYYWSSSTEIGAPMRPGARDACLEKPAHLPTLQANVRRLLASPFPPESFDSRETKRDPTRFVRRSRSPASVPSA